MNCYLCLQEMHNVLRPALALCQRCGAGVCEEHLVELLTRPVVGMAGDSSASPRYTLICRRCYRSASPPTSLACPQKQRREHGERGTLSGGNWWQWFWRRRQSVLPSPQEAVTTVELFLKQEYKKNVK